MRVRTNIGFAEDKSWILRTLTGQIHDKDKMRTNIGFILDIYWTWDNFWTKVGIPTLSTSTLICLHTFKVNRVVVIIRSHSTVVIHYSAIRAFTGKSDTPVNIR